jgi:integrase/recombinase XerD
VSVPLPRSAEEFLSWLEVERGRSPRTLAAYRRDLRAYRDGLATHGATMDAARAADVAAFLSTRRSTHSPASTARAQSSIRGFHRFLVDEGLRPDDPTVDLPSISLSDLLPKALSEEDTERLLAGVVGTGPTVLRDRALLEVLYGTGARVSEAVALNLGDVADALDDDDEMPLVRVLGKGDKERVVPLGRVARLALAEWLSGQGRPLLVPVRWRRRSDAEALFLNARGGRLTRVGAFGVVKKYAARVGLADKVSPHVLRHSCATHMLGRGADVRVVQELLGHASIATTQRYTRVSPEHLRRAYEGAHPRARAIAGTKGGRDRVA